MARNPRQLKDIASALVETAIASSALPEVLLSVYAVRDAFASDRTLIRSLTDSTREINQREKALKQALQGQVHPFAVNALLLLQHEGILGQFDSFTAAVESAAKDTASHRRAEVTSAVGLTADERHALEHALVKKFGGTVELSVRTDPSLIGGLVVQVDGWQFDGSVQNACKRLAETLATP